MNIAFLASHNGSAARAIAGACREGTLSASAVLMVSNNPDCNALKWAREMRLKTAVVNASNAADPDLAIAGLMEDAQIDLIACSGYMKLIGAKTIESVRGAVLNIHPALLPSYGGKGMYGSHVHKAVFENGDAETGITIHLVDAEYDRGRIIAQKRIPLSPGEDAAAIEEKVKAAESAFYIETLQQVFSGGLSLR